MFAAKPMPVTDPVWTEDPAGLAGFAGLAGCGTCSFSVGGLFSQLCFLHLIYIYIHIHIYI